MSVRDPSRRKALKYGAMAALGLGAGVALGEVTGANRLVHAASPSGPDPVFSGTGIQFPSLTSDPSQLVGNMWYRSDLTAMKYSDGTNAHELAALDLAQTFKAAQTFSASGIIIEGAGTGVGTLTYADSTTSGTLTFPAVTDTLAVLGTAQIFTAAQTFDGGIVFNAAGSIASTSTYIEADGAGGNMLVNVPSGKGLILEVGGTAPQQLVPIFNNALQLQSSGANLGSQLRITPSGTSKGATLTIDLTSVVNANILTIGGDGNGNFEIDVEDAPVLFVDNSVEAFRITTTPDLQVSTALRMWTGSATSLTLAPASGLITTYGSIVTVGKGLPAEYASTLTTAVAIGTTSTVIKTYTPTADGQFLVVVSVEASVASTISSLTVTYTDGTSGKSTTQTLATSVAVALNSAVTFTALCNATTATAISVQATAAAGTDLYASATVLAL